jgi:regulatory protein
VESEFRKPKQFTPEQALAKARKYCAYQERSQQEVRSKLKEWGLWKNDTEQIIISLLEEGYLKEERFARAFAGGKFRIKKWGRGRIRQALKEKQVSEPLIRQALSEIDEKEYLKTLRDVIRLREKKEKEKQPYKRINKIASYVISRGFEPELVWDQLRTISE